MSDSIPPLNQNIINAAEQGNLLIFIGAGVSALYGYPVWSKLADEMIDEAVTNKKLNLEQAEMLKKNETDNMKKISIACSRLSGNSKGYIINKLTLDKEIKNKPENKEKLNKISKYLASFKCPIITTNADLSLDETKYFRNGLILNSFEDWNEEYRKISLIHLHGSIKEPENMVFLAKDYAEKYRFDNKKFGKKLINVIGDNRVILFIGYSMSEFELIKYFMVKNNNNNLCTRYLLKGYLDIDRIMIDFDREYFGSLGIELIDFSMEEKSYSALIDVLESWYNIVTNKTTINRRISRIIKETVNKKPSKERIKILEGLLNE